MEPVCTVPLLSHFGGNELPLIKGTMEFQQVTLKEQTNTELRGICDGQLHFLPPHVTQVSRVSSHCLYCVTKLTVPRIWGSFIA